MIRLFPRQVFDDPQSSWALWAFLTSPRDDDFEGQHFDRKEAGRLPGSKNAHERVKELVIKTVSAFANSNR